MVCRVRDMIDIQLHRNRLFHTYMWEILIGSADTRVVCCFCYEYRLQHYFVILLMTWFQFYLWNFVTNILHIGDFLYGGFLNLSWITIKWGREHWTVCVTDCFYFFQLRKNSEEQFLTNVYHLCTQNGHVHAGEKGSNSNSFLKQDPPWSCCCDSSTTSDQINFSTAAALVTLYFFNNPHERGHREVHNSTSHGGSGYVDEVTLPATQLCQLLSQHWIWRDCSLTQSQT